MGPNSRTDRPRKTKIGTEVAHVTRDSDTTFKVKGQGHQAALLSAASTREEGAAVTERTHWAWETTATLRLLGVERGAAAPTRGAEERGHIVSPRAQLLLFDFDSTRVPLHFDGAKTILRPTLLFVGCCTAS